MCIKHGTKKTVKLCSSVGCTNRSKRGGVCREHGAYRASSNDESTAFGSGLEKTTATHISHQSAASGVDSDKRGTGVPGEVVICQEVVEL